MFFKCSRHASVDDQSSGRIVTNGATSKIVDIHCHRECSAAAEMMKAEAERVGFAALSFGSELTKEVKTEGLQKRSANRAWPTQVCVAKISLD